MIVAITTVLNEADIIGHTARHLLNQGVDQIIISDGGSTDGTQAVLLGLPHTTVLAQDGPLMQDDEMNRLADLAAAAGADWIIPFDADEYWCDIANLATVDGPIAYAAMWQYVDHDRRHAQPKPLPKVAFRPGPGRTLQWGNHFINGVDQHGPIVLNVRELQYRDYDHFLAKIQRAADLYASADFPEAYGFHMRRLTAMTDLERGQEWEAMISIPTVHDPIPDYS